MVKKNLSRLSLMDVLVVPNPVVALPRWLADWIARSHRWLSSRRPCLVWASTHTGEQCSYMRQCHDGSYEVLRAHSAGTLVV